MALLNFGGVAADCYRHLYPISLLSKYPLAADAKNGN